MSAKDYPNVSIKTEPLDDTEIIVPHSLSEINVPSIKAVVENCDDQRTQQNGNKSGTPLCIISHVSSIVKLELDTDSDNIQKISSTGSSLTEKSLNVAGNTEVHTKTKQSSLKKAVAWEFAKSFKTFEAAHRYIDDGEYWSFVQQHFGDDGMKNYYRCSQGVASKPQCPAQIYLLFHATSGNVLLCRSYDEHTQHIEIQREDLSERVKEEINKLHDLNLKTAAIVKNLYRLNDIVKPKYSQVDEYVKHRSILLGAARQKIREEEQLLVRKSNKKDTFAQKIKRLNDLNYYDSEMLFLDRKINENNLEDVEQVNELIRKEIVNNNLDSISGNKKQTKCNKKPKQDKSKKDKLYLSDEEVPLSKRKKRKHWILYQEYESEQDARNAVIEDMHWVYSQQHFRKYGLKVYYRCKHGKRKVNPCPASCCLFIHNTSGKSLRYHTPDKHICNLQNPTNNSLKKNVEEEIKKLHASGLKLQFIMSHLAKIDNIELPSEIELKSYLDYLDTHCASNTSVASNSLTGNEELHLSQSAETKKEIVSNKSPEVNNISITNVVVKQ